MQSSESFQPTFLNIQYLNTFWGFSTAEFNDLAVDKCPICQDTFLKTNLEKHAASCGEPAEVNTVSYTRYFLIHVYVSVPHF